MVEKGIRGRYVILFIVLFIDKLKPTTNTWKSGV